MSTILSIGDLHWTSGYDYLLQAYRLLVERKIYFKAIIIGRGILYNELNFSLDDLGLNAFVEISKDVSDDNIQRQIGKSDILVVSELVGNPNSLKLFQKAIALPIKIVRSYGGSIQSTQADSDVLSVPLRNPHAMAEALGKLILSTTPVN